MKPFGDLPIALSWLLAIAMGISLAGAVIGDFIAVMFLFILPLNAFGLIADILVVNLFLPFWMALAYLLMTPLFQLLNVYIYLSPMLIATRTPGGLAIHGGTLFDYVRHMPWSEKGETGKRRLLGYYFQGLLSLVNEIETGRISSDTTISATSHFFSPKNARRLGFKVRTNRLYALGGLLHYPMLILTYSYAKGRLSFPSLSRVVCAQISASELVGKKDLLVKLLSRFNLVNADFN